MRRSTIPFDRGGESRLNKPTTQPTLKLAHKGVRRRSRGPIFVNGFSRGGTTVLANILASHPDTCYLGETHHIFKGHRLADPWWRILARAIGYDLPYILRQREDAFSPRLFRRRREMGSRLISRLKRILERERAAAGRHPMYSQFKSADTPYTARELQNARLLSKNVDGMVYATDILATAFPDATFVSLLRNGLAVCEGHLRRGRSAAKSGWRFRRLVEQMSRDAAALPNYHFVRFEELLADPIRVSRRIYELAGLDPTAVSQIRMQRRRVMDADGNHRLKKGGHEWSVDWLDMEDLPSYFEPAADRNQIVRLSASDRMDFLANAGPAMERLGYLPGRSDEEVDEPRILSLDSYRDSLRRPAEGAPPNHRRKAA